jgi:hypothetical protein
MKLVFLSLFSYKTVFYGWVGWDSLRFSKYLSSFSFFLFFLFFGWLGKEVYCAKTGTSGTWDGTGNGVLTFYILAHINISDRA